MFSKSHLPRLLAFLVAVVAVTIGRDAKASSTPGYVSAVQYFFNNANPYMYIQMNGSATNYIAPTISPGCGLAGVGSDTMRAWVSMAQTALLSGQSTTITYTACSGANYITDILIA